MTDDSPAPGRIDTTVSHTARIWNYWLGGKDNYPVDREVGDQISELLPDVADGARHDRAFLGRVVRYLAGDVGIRQFLDIGTGLPTVDNTHEVAQRVAPESRIVYVDNDPLVLVHARALLTSTPEGVTEYIEADAYEPGKVLEEAARTLDFTRPVGLMLLGVLNHVVEDDKAYTIVETLLDALPEGSHLAITHSCDDVNTEAMHKVVRLWNETGTPKIKARSGQEITRFFDGLELLEPGVVSCSRWRPEFTPFGMPPDISEFGGVGRK